MGRVVGLDIGATAVRGVEVRSGRGGSSVGKMAEVPLPDGAVVAGEIVDPTAVTEALKTLKAKGKFGRNAAIGVANKDLVTRLVDTEWMPHDEATKALRYELSDHIDIGTKDVVHDVHVVREYEVEDGTGRAKKHMSAILVAADEAMVTRFADVVQAAGFMPVRVDASPLALARGMGSSPEDHRVQALVNIGSSMSMVVLTIGGQPIMVRPLPGIGGELVTRALMEEFSDWSREDAEATKMSLGLRSGLVAAARPSFSVFDQPAAPQAEVHPAAGVISQVMENVIGHIRETIDHGIAVTRVNVDSVVLSGGGSRMSGLAERLGSEMGRTVEHAHIGLAGGQSADNAGTFIIAAGLGAE